MPIGWMTALKMVPWGDVIENAPTLVNGAKRLFTKTRTDTPVEPTTPAAGEARTHVDADERLRQLSALLDQSQARITALEAESRDTALLIKSLAEQQAKVVAAIEVLSKRSSLLIGTCVVLVVACAGLAAALFAR
ncbi:hypothetical protein BH09PSE5_BH09PSE5_10950 [soil metagenome]